MTDSSPVAPVHEAVGISVGMCAYNEEKHVAVALASLLAQDLPKPFVLQEVLVVVSGCTDRTEEVVREWSRREGRIVLLQEPIRTGKAHALNWILKEARGDIHVILNADARLEDGALAALVGVFAEDSRAVIACGAPSIPNDSTNPLLWLLDLLWRLHNRTLGALSEKGLANHCCDEFMAMRRGFVHDLPDGLMNDGAYLGALAAARGVSVRFSPAARVFVDPPTTLDGFVRRRQTILRGHVQVKEILRQPSNTLKNLARNSPDLAAKIIVQEFFGDLRSALTAFLLLLPLEGLAAVIARVERWRGRGYEPIWVPVE